MDKLAEGGPEVGLAGRRWVFGQAELDERSLELRVDGTLVPLERKPLEVLIYLLHHAGEAVTKQELAENLWSGRILTDTVLTRCISQVRQALKDDARHVIRTVHGVGYRLLADIKVEASIAAAPPAFDFKPGDRVSRRPQWQLEERLGTGGHGEAWLARHEKTGEPRVFKFARDEQALTSLKREITLYRLMHDTLGERAPIVRILEWNFEEQPYFLESEYVPGRDLRSWAHAGGGLHGIPFADRLELVAQVAEALAAAHSVGVLHKDVKPGNVLILPGKDGVSIKLSDFGSGSVLTPERLEALGITQHGFTAKTPDDRAATTALYLAPEVRRGQPFTVQADIYSLGVLLYQVVVGDLQKAFAPQWENEIEDDVLREDIARAAAGNPQRRLADASHLAELLRTLRARRQKRLDDEAARARAERMRQAAQSLRRTRVFAVTVLMLALGAVAAGVAAYRSRNEAIAAQETAQAINEFLIDDVLHLTSGFVRPSEASYEALLDRAALHADRRLAKEGRAAAELHFVLGRRYHEIGRTDAALDQYERSAAFFRGTDNPEDSDDLVFALDRVAWAHAESGHVAQTIAVMNELRELASRGYPDKPLTILTIRTRIARNLGIAGSFETAQQELRSVISELEALGSSDDQADDFLKQWFGLRDIPSGAAPKVLAGVAAALLGGPMLVEYGDHLPEAEALQRRSLDILTGVYPEGNELIVFSQIGLGDVLLEMGKYGESEALLNAAAQSLDAMLPDWHYARALPLITLGNLRLEQRNSADAVRLLRRALGMCGEGSGCPPRVFAEIAWVLGRALDANNRPNEAVPLLRQAIDTEDRLHGPDRPVGLRIRIDLSHALLRAGDRRAARAAVRDIQASLVSKPALAKLRRLQGLFAEQDGRTREAIEAFEESLHILEARLGPDHWRTLAGRKDLLRAKAVQGRPSAST
jgi:eukaryotic-like serine/threonine-protein kinase